MGVLQKLMTKRTVFLPIGLDVGQTAVRAAQLYRQGGHWHVCTLGSLRLASRKKDAQDPAAITPRVSRWLQQLGCRGRDVVVGLSAPDVDLHAMELPGDRRKLDAKQIGQLAHYEIQRLCRFDEGGAETAFWELPESKSLRSAAIGVAASKERVQSVLALCREAKLDCLRVDASACALARFGAALRGASEDHGDVWGVLDLGGRMSRLIVCTGKVPVLARAFEYGGESWTGKLAESLGVSEETARRHKCDCGIAKLRRDAPAETQCNAVLGEMIFNVLRRDLEIILDELERSYRYVLSCFPERRPGPLFLVGGGSAMHNLDRFIAERVGIEVKVPAMESQDTGNLHFTQVSAAAREPIGSFACAVGLSLAGEASDGQR